MKSFLILILFIFAAASYSKLSTFEATREKREYYSFQDVCDSLGAKDLPIIEMMDMYRLDCMGKAVSVTDFCTTKIKSNDLLRGYIVKEKKMVVCHRADILKLTVLCDERDKDYCLSSKFGCEKLKNIFAKDLSLTHNSITSSLDGIRNLNCYYLNESENMARL